MKATPWWARPRVMLPAVAGLAFLAALFTPLRNGPRTGDARLSTLSTEPLGAMLLHDLLGKLGWRVERQLRPGMPTDPAAIHAVLGPVVPLRATEVHALLQHVRGGGAAFVIAGNSTAPLLDSLHFRVGRGGQATAPGKDTRKCDARPPERFTPLWFGLEPTMLTLEWVAPAPPDATTLLDVRLPPEDGDPETTRPSAVAFTLGAGRMVVAVDPDLVRNDALRECTIAFDLVTVRAFEYLRAGGPVPRERVVFDEYHQAHGAHPGTLGAAAFYLSSSPSGRLLAQLMLAGLVLLVALAPRVVPPRPDARRERRSPLEQVDALARAYEQVRATRTATERLVRGLRRRVERRALRARDRLDDDAWLARLAERTPALRDDVALVRRALAESLPHRTFASLGPALHRIEATLSPR